MCFQKKVTTNFLTGQESRGIVSPRPSEANPVLLLWQALFPKRENGRAF